LLNATYNRPQCITISVNWFILQIILRFYVNLFFKFGLNIQEMSNFNFRFTLEIYNFNLRLKVSQVLGFKIFNGINLTSALLNSVILLVFYTFKINILILIGSSQKQSKDIFMIFHTADCSLEIKYFG
jgi:hypothetical protein